MIFYASPLSSYSAKTRIVLATKGIAFEEREPPEGYRSATYRRINPMGTIPALVADGFVLSESEAINEYLEERFPVPRMLPEDLQARAHTRFLGRYHDLHLEPVVRSLFAHVAPARRNADVVAARADEFRERLARLDRMAVFGPYLATPFLSLADCGHAVSIPLGIMLFEATGHRIALPPRLAAWLQVIDAHSGVAAALAPWRTATVAWIARQLRPAA